MTATLTDELTARYQTLVPGTTSAPTVQADVYGGSFRAFLGDDDPGDDPDAWIIPGIVPAGEPQVMAGHPKSCKTFLAEHLAISIAAGVAWLGREVRRGRALVLPREDSTRETRRRMWRLARGLELDPRDLDGWIQVDGTTPFYWQDASAFDRLRRTIEIFRPSFVVVDSLARTNLGANENSTSEMQPLLNRWADVCQFYGVGVLMIHHFTKTKTGGTLVQQLRGAGGIGATARHIIGVEKSKKPGEPSELSFDGNLHPLPAPFAVRMHDGTDAAGKKTIRFELPTVVVDTKAQQDADDDAAVLDAVLREFAAERSFTRKQWRLPDCREIHKVPEKRATAALERLYAAGRVDWKSFDASGHGTLHAHVHPVQHCTA